MRRRWIAPLVMGVLAFSLVVVPFTLEIEKRLFVLDASTGKLLHSLELEKAGQASVGSMVITGDRIFTETTTKTTDHRYRWNLTMMDTQSGKQRWKFAPDVTPSRFWDLAIPIYVGKNSVYVSVDHGQEHDQLLALDIATGKPRWTLARDWPGSQWPNANQDISLNRLNLGAIEAGDRLIMLAPSDDGKTVLQAIDQKTVKPIWQVKFAEVNFPPITLEQDYTLVSGDRTVTFLDPNGTTHTYDVATGQLQFTLAEKFIAIKQSSSTVYGLKQGGIDAIDATTGKTRWSYSIQPNTNATCARGGQFKRLQPTRQVIYVTCVDDQESTLLTFDETGKLLWSKPISSEVLPYLDRTASNLESVLVPVYEQSGAYVSAVSSQQGTQHWRFPPQPLKNFYPSEVAADDHHVFVINYERRWRRWLVQSGL
jgi:outer membrane protein assembly factor BamB